MSSSHDDEDMSVSVVGKKFLDSARLHNDVIRLEDTVSRKLRTLSRKVVSNYNSLANLSGEVNTGFQTIGGKMDTFVEWTTTRIADIETVCKINPQMQEDQAEPEGQHEKIPNIHEIEQQVRNPLLDLDDSVVHGTNEDESDEVESELFISMMTQEKFPQITPFDGDSTTTFQSWAQKFRDYLQAVGSKWTPDEKLGRLKLFLNGTPRQLLEELAPADVDTALENLIKLIDSPQKRDLARQSLITCKQNSGESVQRFIERLTPLVEAAYASLDAKGRKERLCEAFLEKLDPEIAFLVKLTGAHSDFEKAKTKAMEVENMLANRKQRDANFWDMAMINAAPTSSKFPEGNFRSWRPETADQKPQQSWTSGNQHNTGRLPVFRDLTERNRTQSQYDHAAGGQASNHQYNGVQRQNFRGQRPICNYCKKVGHVIANCWSRQRLYGQYPPPQPPGFQPRNRSGSNGPPRNNYHTGYQHYSGFKPAHDQMNSMSMDGLADLVKEKLIHDFNPSPPATYPNNLSPPTTHPNNLNPLMLTQDKGEVKSSKLTESNVVNLSNWETPRKSLAPFVTPLLPILCLLLIIPSIGAMSPNPNPRRPNIPPYYPSHPLVCQTQHGAYWQVPAAMKCPDPKNLIAPVQNRAISLFKYKLVDMITEAWACRRVRNGLREYTNPADDQIKDVFQPENIPVSTTECKRMVQEKHCERGALTEENGLWHTNEQLEIQKRWPIVGWSWKNHTIENCFLFRTKVFLYTGELNIHSELGKANCAYTAGSCQLPDGTQVIWEPQLQDSKCKYRFVDEYKGRLINNIWVGSNVELALSWHRGYKTFHDCGHELILTEQGYAIEIIEEHDRQKRRTGKGPNDALVFESELVSRLSYVDVQLRSMLSYTIAHTLTTICQHLNETKQLAFDAIAANPSAFARTIFQTPNLHAEIVTPSVIKVWPCIQLTADRYNWRKTKDECFEFLPIEIKTGNEPQLAFVNPKTMIVSPLSRKSSCTSHRKIPILINNSLVEVDQFRGVTSPMEIRTLNSNTDPIEAPILEPHAYHAVAFSNFTDIITHTLVNNLMQLTEMTYRIQLQISEGRVTSSFSEEWAGVKQALLSDFFDGWTLAWIIVISTICLVLSADFCIRLYSMVREHYGLNRKTVSISSPILPTHFTTPLHVRTISGVDEKISGVEIISGVGRKISKPTANSTADNESQTINFSPPNSPSPIVSLLKGNPIAWPPSVSQISLNKPHLNQSSGQVMAMEGYEDAHRFPIIELKINGVPINCLIDTGASHSIALDSIVQKVGQSGPLKPINRFVETASGGSIHLQSEFDIRLGYGNREEYTEIALAAPGEFIPTNNYEIVIGTDILTLLPNPIQFDFHTANIIIGNQSFPMIKVKKAHDAILSFHCAPPSAIVLRRINGELVRCLMDTGASLTAAPLSIAQKLKCQVRPNDNSARSASGHRMRIDGMADAELFANGKDIPIVIQFVRDEDFNQSNNYEMIIGCDTFMKISPITFNFDDQTLNIGRETLPMVESSKFLPRVPIRALETITLLPGSQKVVEASLETSESPDAVLIEEVSKKLAQADIGIIPAVSTPKNSIVSLVLANSCSDPKIIYKNTTIGFASEVKQDWEGVFNETILDSAATVQRAEEEPDTEIDPSFKIDFSKSSVTGDDLKKLKALCEKYQDVFSKSQYDLGCCNVGAHHIETTTEAPIKSRPHRSPFRYKDELEKHIEKLLKAKIIVESDTPWVSNFVLVKKKDGTLRPCIDFRKLNAITVPDHFPLPRFDVILEKIGQCNFYSSLDLSSGYFQIPLTEAASRKCGIITESKIYQTVRMPFGLRNATSAFGRTMALVLSGLDDAVIAYVDDIVVYTRSSDFSEHLRALEAVFQRFRLYNLKLSPKKCTFATKEMTFLGYLINEHGYSPSLAKVENIKDIPSPTNLKQVRRAVGMASFFRRHIPNFSAIVEPLTRLTKKENKFRWGPEQQMALDRVKELLSSAPVLAFPDYDKPFHIFCDASLVGQGGALMQKDDDGRFKAIAYCSRTLSSAERKWPPVQVELSAIIFSLREFRGFIYLAEIELHTDHRPLSFLMKKADTAPNLARWLIELQNYNIRIVHVSGKENSLADALSRAAEDLPEKEVESLKELEDIAEFPVCLSLSIPSRMVFEHFVNNLTIRDAGGKPFVVDIAKEQSEDPEAKAFADFLLHGTMPDRSEVELEKFVANAKDLEVSSGILYFHPVNTIPKIYIPVSLRPLIFEAIHASPLAGGHMSFSKTLAKSRRFFWPKMYLDLREWCRQCVKCQLRNSPTPGYRAEMSSVPVNTVFAKVGLDLTGPLPTSEEGNKYILNVICWFSKYIVSVPLKDTKSLTVAKALLRNVYLVHGGCSELISDNATTFTSEFFREFSAMLYINKSYSTPYYSQGNGITERSFRTFHSILAKYLDPKDANFEEYLHCAAFAYNTSTHGSTGETPYFLMHGRDPILNIEQLLDPKLRVPITFSPENDFKARLILCLRRAWEAADQTLMAKRSEMKRQYVKKLKPQEIAVGDRVLIKNYVVVPGSARKWHMPWRGIFRVIGKDSMHLTLVSCSSPQSKPIRLHINQVKKFVEPTGPAITTPDLSHQEKRALGASDAQELEIVPGYSHTPHVVSEKETKTADDESERAGQNPSDGRKYNLRPRLPKISEVVSLVCLVSLATAHASKVSELSTNEGASMLSLIIISFLGGLSGSLIFIISQRKKKNRMTHDESVHHNHDFLRDSNCIKGFCSNVENCLFRKLGLKGLIPGVHPSQIPDRDELCQIGQSFGDNPLFSLGTRSGNDVFALSRAISEEEASEIGYYNNKGVTYYVKDPFSKRRRPARLIAVSEMEDHIFWVNPFVVGEQLYPSYYLIVTAI